MSELRNSVMQLLSIVMPSWHSHCKSSSSSF